MIQSGAKSCRPARWRRCLPGGAFRRIIGLAGVLLALCGPAAAQDTADDRAAAAATQAKVDQLVQLLSDPAVRAALSATVALPPAPAAPAPNPEAARGMARMGMEAEGSLDLWVADVKANLWRLLRAADGLPEALDDAMDEAGALLSRTDALRVVLLLAMVLGGACAVEAACGRLLSAGPGSSLPMEAAAPGRPAAASSGPLLPDGDGAPGAGPPGQGAAAASDGVPGPSLPEGGGALPVAGPATDPRPSVVPEDAATGSAAVISGPSPPGSGARAADVASGPDLPPPAVLGEAAQGAPVSSAPPPGGEAPMDLAPLPGVAAPMDPVPTGGTAPVPPAGAMPGSAPPAPEPRERAGHEGLPLFAFAMALMVLFLLARWPAAIGPLVQPWLIALIFVRVVRRLVRLSFRLPGASPLPDAPRFWLRRLTGIAIVIGLGWAGTRMLLLLDAPLQSVLFLRYLFAFAIILLSILTIWDQPTSPAERVERRSRRLFLTVWLMFVAVLEVTGAALMFWLAVYAVALPPALRQVTRIVRGSFAWPSLGAAPLRVVLADRGARAVVVGGAALWLGWLIRTHPDRTMMTDETVSLLIQGLVRGVMILLLADLLWHAVKAGIDQSLAHAETIGDEAAMARNARLRTLLPIFRSMAGVAILTVALMMVLAGLGVEIGPLIAGAGVFGVAIGFGSQTLVKDIISGIFYMLDDAFRVGEYIQSGNYRGVVEGFSLRSVRLRHHRGPIFTVPFGSLGAVQNMSRDWSKDKFLITVPFDTDIEKVRKLVKKVGEALLVDPEFGDLFIQQLKMKGVEQFGDYGITLGVAMVLKPTPLTSMIRRRAYMMIRQAFQENGIEFASPRVQVAGGGDAAAEHAAALAVETRRQAEAAQAAAGT